MSFSLTQEEVSYLRISDVACRFESRLETPPLWSNKDLADLLYDCRLQSKDHYESVAKMEIEEGDDWSEKVPTPEGVRQKWRMYYGACRSIMEKCKLEMRARRQLLLVSTPEVENLLLFAVISLCTHPCYNESFLVWEPRQLTSPTDIDYATACTLQTQGWIEGTYNEDLQEMQWEVRKRDQWEPTISLFLEAAEA